MLPREVASWSACIKMSQVSGLGICAYLIMINRNRNIQSYNELLKTVTWNVEVSMSPLVPERKKSGTDLCRTWTSPWIGWWHRSGLISDQAIRQHHGTATKGDSGAKYVLDLSHQSSPDHLFPGSLRAELPCTNCSHLNEEAEVPAHGAPRQPGFFLPWLRLRNTNCQL